MLLKTAHDYGGVYYGWLGWLGWEEEGRRSSILLSRQMEKKKIISILLLSPFSCLLSSLLLPFMLHGHYAGTEKS